MSHAAEEIAENSENSAKEEYETAAVVLRTEKRKQKHMWLLLKENSGRKKDLI